MFKNCILVVLIFFSCNDTAISELEVQEGLVLKKVEPLKTILCIDTIDNSSWEVGSGEYRQIKNWKKLKAKKPKDSVSLDWGKLDEDLLEKKE